MFQNDASANFSNPRVVSDAILVD